MDHLDIKITAAEPRDIEGILDVQKVTWLATYVNKDYGITAEDIEAKNFTDENKINQWRKRLSGDTAYDYAWVAHQGGKVIAFCRAEKTDKINKIKALYVLPDYQSRGLGKEMINLAIAWLGDENDIQLDVAAYNAQAIRFYEKLDFKKAGETPEEDSVKLPSGKTLPEIRMLKNKL